MSVPVTLVGEGFTDLAVLRALLAQTGLALAQEYDCGGKADLCRRLPGFNNAAQRRPWLVALDLDREACAVAYAQSLLPAPAPGMHLRVAVRATEAWLLADTSAIAAWLHIPVSRVPHDPESLEDPKRTLVDLARTSSSSAVRSTLVPRVGSGRSVGAGYAGAVVRFAQEQWDARRAARTSDSVKRTIARMELLKDRMGA